MGIEPIKLKMFVSRKLNWGWRLLYIGPMLHFATVQSPVFMIISIIIRKFYVFTYRKSYEYTTLHQEDQIVERASLFRPLVSRNALYFHSIL